MELRELTSDYERKIFAQRLASARATRGVRFREKIRSRLGEVHLAFGDVYAIFEHEGEPPEKMVGGFVAHNLASFPQSYPKPDLSHLPPQSVLEGGELWSLSTGIGRVARMLAAAVAGLRKTRAIVLYPICKPFDLSSAYVPLGFRHAGVPIRWPYIETLAGEDVWVLPMVLTGRRLRDYVTVGLEFLSETGANYRSLSFKEHPSRPDASASAEAKSPDTTQKNLLPTDATAAEEVPDSPVSPNGNTHRSDGNGQFASSAS